MQASEPRRVIIHAGFHKTGTTSVQRALEHSRQALAPCLHVILKPDIPDLCQAAIAYARAPSEEALELFRQQAAQCFANLPAGDMRPLLISAEDLCGQIPGRHGRVGYPQAPVLLAALISVVPAHAAVRIYLSTRARTPWLRSCYAHHLRHGRMQMSEATFMKKHAHSPALTDVAAAIAAHLKGIPVVTYALEDVTSHPQGPLTPLLDLAGIAADDRTITHPHRRANRSLPPDILAQFLVLNRQEADATTRNAAKQALITAHRRGKT